MGCSQDSCSANDNLGGSAKYLLQMLNGIPLAVLKQKYSESIIELCERALIWRYVLEDLWVIPNVSEYKIKKENGQDIVKILDVFMRSDNFCGDKNCQSCQCESFDIEIPKVSRIKREAGNVQGWYEPEPAVILFNECFAEKKKLRVSIALKPEIGATSIPPDLMMKWKKTIEFGTIAKAHLMPDQSWSSVDRFDYFNRLFEGAIVDHNNLEKSIEEQERRDLDVCRPEYRDDVRFSRGIHRCC